MSALGASHMDRRARAASVGGGGAPAAGAQALLPQTGVALAPVASDRGGRCRARAPKSASACFRRARWPSLPHRAGDTPPAGVAICRTRHRRQRAASPGFRTRGPCYPKVRGGAGAPVLRLLGRLPLLGARLGACCSVPATVGRLRSRVRPRRRAGGRQQQVPLALLRTRVCAAGALPLRPQPRISRCGADAACGAACRKSKPLQVLETRRRCPQWS